MEYNYFGCTQDNIIASFSGAISGDFATSVYSASTVLTQELDFAEAELVAKLGSGLLKMFSEVKGIKPEYVNGEFVFPAELPYGSDLRVWIIPEDNEVTSQTTLNCSSGLAKCSNFNLESMDEQTVTMNISGSGFTIDNYTYNPDDKVYMNYKPNVTTLNLPSLAGLIRDMVCCTVGSNLYSKEDTEWKHITRFCERATKRLDEIDEYFLPPEFRKYNWYKSPVPTKGGISTIKLGRA